MLLKYLQESVGSQCLNFLFKLLGLMLTVPQPTNVKAAYLSEIQDLRYLTCTTQ